MDLNRTATLRQSLEIDTADILSPKPSARVRPSEAELAVATARRLNTEAQALRLRVQALVAAEHLFAVSGPKAANDADPDKIEALLAPPRS